MKVKDLFDDLLNSEDVSTYNPRVGYTWVGEGEFKQIPQQYFEHIIDTMYSAPTISKGTYNVINLKNEFYKRVGSRWGRQCTRNI